MATTRAVHDQGKRISAIVKAVGAVPPPMRRELVAVACHDDPALRGLLGEVVERVTRDRDRPEEWERASRLFEVALELSPEERHALLERECADAPELRRLVTDLLAHAEDETFLASSPSDPYVGRRVGDYVLEALVGQGGMGRVYRAHDVNLRREAAVKAVRPEMSHDLRFRERLKQEARAAARLLAHENVAVVYSLMEEPDAVFFASEFVHGPTLETLMRNGPLPRAVLLRIFEGIARGLAAAHALGIVHRDLKPGNVMLAESGNAKIVDFGLARITDAAPGSHTRQTETTTRAGTLAYMAPEQIEGLPLDFRADQFAFGIMLYEAATGVHPFEGATQESTIVHVRTRDPLPFATRVSSDLVALAPIVDRCLRKDPRERYGSTDDLLHDLRAVAGTTGSGLVSGTQRRPRPGIWWWRVHQVVVSSAYTLTLLALWPVHALVTPPGLGLTLLLTCVLAVVFGVVLRLFLCYASFDDEPDEFDATRLAMARWVRLTDHAICLVLFVLGGALLWVSRPGTAVPILIIGVVYLLASLVIEPFTTRRAFRRRGGTSSGPTPQSPSDSAGPRRAT